MNIPGDHQENSSEIESIKLHLRIYHSILKSSGEIHISHLQQTHDEMKSILHLQGGKKKIDLPTFIYTSLRLPESIHKVRNIILGQSPEVFKRGGYPDVEKWERVLTPGRRRRLYFDKKETLACFITSISDIDDLINILIAFQEEWNKFHEKLQLHPFTDIISELDPESWRNLQSIWGGKKPEKLGTIKEKRLDFQVKLLAGSWLDYTKVVQKWWKNISATLKPELRLTAHSVYFVSSNTHSIVNLVSGYVLKKEKEIAAYLEKRNPIFLTFTAPSSPAAKNFP